MNSNFIKIKDDKNFIYFPNSSTVESYYWPQRMRTLLPVTKNGTLYPIAILLILFLGLVVQLLPYRLGSPIDCNLVSDNCGSCSHVSFRISFQKNSKSRGKIFSIKSKKCVWFKTCFLFYIMPNVKH